MLTDWRLQTQYEIFPEWRWRYAPGVTHNTEHVFGLMLPAPCALVAPREHLSFLWLPWQEAAQRCFSWSNAAAIRRLPGNGCLTQMAQPGDKQQRERMPGLHVLTFNIHKGFPQFKRRVSLHEMGRGSSQSTPIWCSCRRWWGFMPASRGAI